MAGWRRRDESLWQKMGTTAGLAAGGLMTAMEDRPLRARLAMNYRGTHGVYMVRNICQVFSLFNRKRAQMLLEMR